MIREAAATPLLVPSAGVAHDHPTLLRLAVLVLAAGVVGTADEPADAPKVPVSRPLAREVTDQQQYTGRTEAATVDLRARVSGYLLKAPFEEGGEVKQGDLLFEIDPRPYQAELDRAKAQLVLGEARLQRTDAEVKRARALLDRKVLSQEDYDKALGERREAEAGVAIARAGLEAARLTLEFTKVTAPLSGRIGRRLVTPGNLVRADETLLATIATQDPMFVYFDIDERTWLRLRRAVQAGTIKPLAGSDLPVRLGLADEDGFPREGRLTFADVRADPNTGTVRLRATVANKDGLLVPGLFVRVRLPVGAPHKALLVPQEAVGSDQGRAFVWVVGEKDSLQQKKVELGARHGGLRAVTRGLDEEDRVVLGGLKGLRAGMIVQPQKATIPEP
jgi:RND family efflux transporter MFP subunit